MRNYLRAELYRNFHRKSLWVTMGSVIACILIGILCFQYMNTRIPATEVKIGLEMVFIVGISALMPYVYLMLVFTDISIGEEIKNNTIKNIISSGLSRGKIYVCKVIEASIFMILCSVATLVSTIVFGYLILGIQQEELFSTMSVEFIKRGSVAILLYMGAIALGSLLALIIKQGTVASLMYIFLFLFLGKLFGLLGTFIHPIFTKMKPYLLSSQISLICQEQGVANSDIIMAGVIGIIYAVVLTIIGVVVIRKKDI